MNSPFFKGHEDFPEIKEKLESNKILNGLTLIALQWFFLNYS